MDGVNGNESGHKVSSYHMFNAIYAKRDCQLNVLKKNLSICWNVKITVRKLIFYLIASTPVDL